MLNEEWLKSDSFRPDIVCANLRVRVNFCLNREKLEGRVKKRKYEEWNALKINSLINIIARFFFQHIKNIYFKCYHKILNIF